MGIHIDPINGSDSASGDKDNPLRSFDEYNRRYPNGGYYTSLADVATGFFSILGSLPPGKLQEILQYDADTSGEMPPNDEPLTKITGIEYTGTRHYKKAIIDTFSVKVITPSGEEETWQLFSSAKGQR